MANPTTAVRLDKWLWAARFFKTRSLASQAIDAGHVHINGERAKPSRLPKIGDLLRIQTVSEVFEVAVQVLADRRESAAIAQCMYAETEASQLARANVKAEKALAPVFDHPDVRGRPSKKWRRQLHLFERKNQV